MVLPVASHIFTCGLTRHHHKLFSWLLRGLDMSESDGPRMGWYDSTMVWGDRTAWLTSRWTRSFYPCIISLPERREQSLHWFMTSVAHTMSKKLLGSITILLVKFHWIETTLHHFECPTRHDYIQPKNILAPACVHYLKRIGIMQISLRYLLWNVRIDAAYSNIVVAVVDIQVLTCQKL